MTTRATNVNTAEPGQFTLARSVAYPAGVPAMFRALRNRNFRLYFAGQAVSMCGTAAQVVAVPWLVLQLTGSGTRVGAVTALQFVPVLIFGAWAGVIADRYDNRRTVLVVQTFLAVQAAVLATLVLTDAIALWMVYVLAVVQGIGSAFDIPNRQSLLGEIVGDADLPNALGLNGSLFQIGRIVGPFIAGVLIGTVGIGLCFAVNALSYLAIVVMVLLLDRQAFIVRPRRQASTIKTRDGIAYALNSPEIRNLLAIAVVVGTMAGNLPVVLPLLAERVFGGGSNLYTAMSAMAGAGALVAALGVSSRYRPTKGLLLAGVAMLAVACASAALAPSLVLAMAALFFIGGAGTVVGIGLNGSLQLGCLPHFRGRVIALYFLISQGSNVVGAPLLGWIAETFGTRWSLGLGAVIGTITWCVVLSRWRRRMTEAGAVAPAATAAVAVAAT